MFFTYEREGERPGLRVEGRGHEWRGSGRKEGLIGLLIGVLQARGTKVGGSFGGSGER